MRILLLTQYYPPEVGAPQTRLSALVRELEEVGDEVEVVTALPNYPTGAIFPGFRHRLVSTFQEGSVRVHRVWMWAAMGTGTRRILSYLSFTATSVFGLLKARRPDVIVIESPPLFVAVPGILYGRVRGIPIVVNVADLWPDAAVAVGALAPGRVLDAMLALERWTYRCADLVSTVTDGVRARLLEKGVPEQKVVMLVNGVDVEMFRPDRGNAATAAALGLPDGPFMVYAGTMGLAHDLDPLLTAMGLLRADDGVPSLVLIGGGSERARLEQRACAEQLTNVVFRDPVPPATLAEVLPLAEFGIVTLADIPLNRDTRPAKLLPLMASGIPALFAGTGEGTRVLTEDHAGLAVPNDAEAIAQAIRQLHSAAEDRRSMAAAGRAAAVERWSWRAHVAPWRDAVLRAVTRRRSKPTR